MTSTQSTIGSAEERAASARPHAQRPWWQHAVVAGVLSTVAWSAAEQQWRIAVMCLILLSFVALLMGRGSRGDHISPSPWHMAALAGALSVPPLLAIVMDQPHGLSETSSALACVVVFGAMRVDEKRCKTRLANGDFHDSEIW